MNRGPATCSLCGQVLPPQGLALPRVKRRIFELVQRNPGIDAERLRALVWDGVDGGPENPKNLHAHIWGLNEKLRPLGLMVRGSVSGGYRLQPINGGRP
jgi:hypothetical protein